MHNSGVVELHFPIRGASLPSDHAYPLYAAVTKLVQSAHNASWLGIHTIRGRRLGDGTLAMSRSARLRIRLPADQVPEFLQLAGATLDVAGHCITCGIPTVRHLAPARRLRSRFVMIKCKGSEGKTAEINSFLHSLRRQIDELGISADIILERQNIPRGSDGLVCRRVLKVKSAVLTGYGVILENLNDSDSVLVQEKGLGGKRRMGCGIFEPLGSGG